MKERIKERIISELKQADYCSYTVEEDTVQDELTDNDWQDIADAVGSDIYYDPCGISYTANGMKKFFRVKNPERIGNV